MRKGGGGSRDWTCGGGGGGGHGHGGEVYMGGVGGWGEEHGMGLEWDGGGVCGGGWGWVVVGAGCMHGIVDELGFLINVYGWFMVVRWTHMDC